ncbi:dihydropteroate synthase [Streptomyces noursei]|uniref:dihydropteroate synthase n=1 Tax=Streptomyces noursei TaxID=1971 RepID=UPI0033D28B9B
MHWRGQSAGMDDLATYGDVVGEVIGEVERQMSVLVPGGVDPVQVIVDPGLGFVKTRENDWSLLARLEAWASLGRAGPRGTCHCRRRPGRGRAARDARMTVPVHHPGLPAV